MTDFEQLLGGPLTLREREPKMRQERLVRYDHLILYHETFDERQEFHDLMDLLYETNGFLMPDPSPVV
jgi:hypothetical protein